MTAFVVVTLNVHSPEWVPDYFTHVPALVRKHGGQYLAVAKGAVKVLEGAVAAPQAAVIMSFPSLEAVKTFHADPTYAPYRDARLSATESTFIAFVNDPEAPQFIGQ